jgi:hypothetical protein
MGISRRKHLTSLGSALIAGTGCTANKNKQPKSTRLTIPELWIENQDTTSHRVDVLLLHSDEPIFLKSLTVGPAEYDGDDLQTTGGQTWQNVAPKKQRYTLHARIDDGTWATTRFTQTNSSCVRMEVEIDTQAKITFVYFGCN